MMNNNNKALGIYEYSQQVQTGQGYGTEGGKRRMERVGRYDYIYMSLQ